MPQASPVVVWFRGDLRLADNPALAAACATGAPLILVYVLDETAPGRPAGGASRWWLDKSLKSLASDIAALGGRLILRRGSGPQVVRSLASETGASAVMFNRIFEQPSVELEDRLCEELSLLDIDARRFNGSLLVDPDSLGESAAASAARTFSAFWRKAAPLAEGHPPLPRPSALRPSEVDLASETLESWRLLPTHPDWSGGFSDWTPGEAGAAARLASFLHGGLGRYLAVRNRPDLDATSRLSPHLAFGEISPRQIWAGVREAQGRGAPASEADGFLRELGWRDFNHHLLWRLPQMTSENLNSKFEAMPWTADPAALKAWRTGRTGYPIIDAAMRQLWVSGWMHNRLRMVVASFLTKDLLIDWRVGEAWFCDTLVDANPANNAGGWQWTAGTGVDSAPYFRIFNPTLQAARFDPDGVFVRRWLPELAGLPAAIIHSPWTADAAVLHCAGVKLGETYPHPIVDHAVARTRALALFKELG